MNRALTGIRPTGDLTVANYVGAMEPIVALQDSFEGPINTFVADLHALTDQEPGTANRTRLDVVRSYLAAGVTPDRARLYLQSHIGQQTTELASLLDRHISLAEIMLVPTLKDKLQPGQSENNASMALARYPVLMAADILIQDATHVPVGKDQYPHIEVTRKLTRRWNARYGNDDEELKFNVPDVLESEGTQIADLVRPDKKMSKSNPRGAIFLRDTPDEIARKIKKARTGLPGEIDSTLESHFTLTKRLAASSEVRDKVANLRTAHLAGAAVMGEFKGLMTDTAIHFVTGFQERFNSISDAEVKQVLRDGGAEAREEANGVMARVHRAMNIVSAESLLSEG
jgi:tryptophanyl-tRNA synthetase